MYVFPRMTVTQPGYLTLYRSGELAWRAQRLEARLSSCDLCPRECRTDRLNGDTGYCRSGPLPIVASACAHFGEEPALSGTRGSGTIFFGNCNLRCVYCQNHQVSQDWKRQKANEADCHSLALQMLDLQDRLGCHNINFVSPSHFVPQIVRAVLEAVPLGLRVPLVYNTSGYDSVSTIRELDGIVDIYMPDIRYASDQWAGQLSGAPDYVERARPAIAEMYRQVGDLVLDESGVARRGLIVRHLILPNDLAGTEESLTWLATEVSRTVTVSLMSQYMPVHRAHDFPLLSRRISWGEYQAALRALTRLGLENGWVQEMGAAENYLPDFAREGHPFGGDDAWKAFPSIAIDSTTGGNAIPAPEPESRDRGTASRPTGLDSRFRGNGMA